MTPRPISFGGCGNFRLVGPVPYDDVRVDLTRLHTVDDVFCEAINLAHCIDYKAGEMGGYLPHKHADPIALLVPGFLRAITAVYEWRVTTNDPQFSSEWRPARSEAWLRERYAGPSARRAGRVLR